MSGGVGGSVLFGCGPSAGPRRGAHGATGPTGATGAAGPNHLSYLQFSGSGTGDGYLADSGNGFSAYSVAEADAFGYAFQTPVTVVEVTVLVRANDGHSLLFELVDLAGAALTTPLTLSGSGVFVIPVAVPFTATGIGALVTVNAGTPVLSVTVGYR